MDIVSNTELVYKFGIDRVVIDDFNKLWEMPSVPFLQSHTKRIDILIQLLNKSNGLNNWFILPVYICGALLSGIAMTKTELCSSHILIFDLLHDLDKVCSDTSLELSNRLIEGCSKSGFSENSI